MPEWQNNSTPWPRLDNPEAPMSNGRMFPTTTNILIVDDSKIIAEMTSQILTDLGYDKITFAKDGVDALDQMAQAQISGNAIGLIICDWRMPKMGGLSFLKTIRDKPEWSKVPFLVLSSVDQADEITQALTAGANSYLVKPPEKESLKKKLEDIWAKVAKG
jgi:two-component system, chemotaxis family, chemotaxis protein CheY